MSFVPADYWPPGPPTGGAALDQTARDAAAAAQSTANAAVSTGAELSALLTGDPAAADAIGATRLKWRGGLTGEVLRTLLAHLADLAVSLRTFGAALDATATTATLTLTAGQTAITVPGATFSAAGGAIVLPGCGPGGAPLVTTYTSAGGTSSTLATGVVTAIAAVPTLVTYGTDDTAAYQAWLDHCRINRRAGYHPAGRGLITAPLHVTPGSTGFWASTITGAGAGYDISATNAARGESVIDASALYDRPALFISSARAVTIRGIGILGGNTAPNAAISGAGLSVNPANDTESAWVSPGFRNTRYSPHAGICIDGLRSTTPPDGGYPGQTYNAAFTASSQVHIADCTIRQFVVGVLNSPTANATIQQGDSVYMQGLKIYACTVCCAAGESQTKGCYLTRSAFGSFRTVLDTVTYGQQSGQTPLCSSLEIGNGLMFFRINPGFSPLDATNVYLEQCACLGFAFTTSGAQSYIRLDGCYFKRGTNYLQPPILLEAGCPVFFSGYMSDGSGAATPALGQNLQNVYNVVGAPFNFVTGTVDVRQADELLFGFVEAALDNVRLTDLSASGRDSSSKRRYANHFVAPTSLSGRYNPARTTTTVTSVGQTYLYTPGTAFNRLNLGASVSNIVGAGTATMTCDLDASGLLFVQVGDVVLWKIKGLQGAPGAAQQTYVMPAYKVTGIAAPTVTFTALFDTAYYDTAYTTFGVVMPEWAPLQALTCTMDGTTAVLTSVSPVGILKNGDWVKGASAGIPTNTRVLSGGGTATVTLSRATTAAGANTLFYGRLQTPTVTAAF